MWRPLVYSLFAFFCIPECGAQTVLYSPEWRVNNNTRYEVAGKVGPRYWVLAQSGGEMYSSEKNTRKKPLTQQFLVFDGGMNRAGESRVFTVPENTEKVFLVPGNRFMDRLLVMNEYGQTRLIVQRIDPSLNGEDQSREMTVFPFPESGNSFLLARCENRQRILLLCFEGVPEAPPRLHALQFDENWNLLSSYVYDQPNISQPLIQDDFISYPLEYFNSAAIQLADNGQWLMASRSRSNNNYLLFHFCANDPALSFKEMNIPEHAQLEDVSLSLNNKSGEAFAGLLCRFKYPTMKSVQVAHYSLIDQAFDFDSSYRFNTLNGITIQRTNLSRERFTAVPGRGFMLMKEYGKSYDDLQDIIQETPWDVQALFAGNGIATNAFMRGMNRDSYTRSDRLSAIGNRYTRGDLCLFYLPAVRGDSSWCGLLNKEQFTDFNSPWLSYLFLSSGSTFYFLYNTVYGDEQSGSSTLLDAKGNEETGGVVFWKYRVNLDFQQARRIEDHEVAVPYLGSGRTGFAVIRL